MRHRLNTGGELDVVENGMDLTSYYPSVEWDLMKVWAQKTNNHYPCCDEPYPDVTFKFIVRPTYLAFYLLHFLVGWFFRKDKYK